ncbi:hypothetical protein NJBCHELONAE_43250 [Mycobacteroides chelonae]|nr:hypothetical protein NJBCHELONAE_43250 [Mycobacteroides chelonae]
MQVERPGRTLLLPGPVRHAAAYEGFCEVDGKQVAIAADFADKVRESLDFSSPECCGAFDVESLECAQASRIYDLPVWPDVARLGRGYKASVFSRDLDARRPRCAGSAK